MNRCLSDVNSAVCKNNLFGQTLTPHSVPGLTAIDLSFHKCMKQMWPRSMPAYSLHDGDIYRNITDFFQQKK